MQANFVATEYSVMKSVIELEFSFRLQKTRAITVYGRLDELMFPVAGISLKTSMIVFCHVCKLATTHRQLLPKRFTTEL